MGWKKILSHSIGGDVALGNWRASYNSRDDSIDILHPSDGISYVKHDTTFSGTLTELIIDAGSLKINQYPGWSDAIERDEAVNLDDTTVWDDVTGTGDQLLDYLFGSTQVPMYYKGLAEFISDAIDLVNVGKYHSSKSEWTADVPVGTVLDIYCSLYTNGVWGAWSHITANGDALGCLPAIDNDVSFCKIRYKIVFTPATDLLSSPSISELITTLNSQKHFRIIADGVYKESSHIISSIAGATTETLI